MAKATLKDASDALDVAHKIGREFLQGNDPAIQGAILAELVGTWVAKHHPETRDAVIAHWLATVKALADISSKEIWPSEAA